MKRYIVSFVLILLAFTSHARAQEAKKPYLEGLLQDVLSSPQMQVEVQGLRGTFSSNATVKELTFADELGVWMRIEEAQLVWSRSALLKRRVDIQKLNAEKNHVISITPSVMTRK